MAIAVATLEPHIAANIVHARTQTIPRPPLTRPTQASVASISAGRPHRAP